MAGQMQLPDGGRRGFRGRRRFLRPAMLLAAATALSLPLGGLLRVAFVAPPARGLSRRALAAEAALLLAAGPAAAARADQEPLPGFFIKDLEKSSDQIQLGMDWLFFELKPALAKEDIMACRKVLGGSISGSHISPVTSNLLLPMEQLLSANLDSPEDGWTDAMAKLRNNMEEMSENVGSGSWKEARANWDAARDGANFIMTNINKRAPEEYFTLPDSNYEKSREKIYIKGKKEMLADRNRRGTIMMR